MSHEQIPEQPEEDTNRARADAEGRGGNAGAALPGPALPLGGREGVPERGEHQETLRDLRGEVRGHLLKFIRLTHNKSRCPL